MNLIIKTTFERYLHHHMKNYSSKLAIRNLLKQKTFTFISLAGLATSLAAVIVIGTYVLHELSYDRHLPDADRTYRVLARLGEGNFWSRTFASCSDALTGDPRVEELCSFIYARNSIVEAGQQEFTVSEALLADSSLIDFFGLELISGRKEDLGRPNQVFITGEMAEILFGDGDPLGRQVFLRQLEGNLGDSLGYYNVAGVVRPLPDQTHFGFQMIFSQQGHLAELIRHQKEGKVFGCHVYVRLYPEVSRKELEAEIGGLLRPFLESRPGPPLEAFNFALQAVNDIHFTLDINREPRPVTRKSMLYVLITVGFLILLLMTLNFITAVIVQSEQQQKTSRILRILGAGPFQVLRLSLVKISVLVGLSLLFSWIFIAAGEAWLKSLFGPDWSFGSLNAKIIGLGLATVIPVIFFTSASMFLAMRRLGSFRYFGVLTVVQFVVVIVLLNFTLLIKRQMSYMEQKDLGYAPENLWIVAIPGPHPRGSFLVEEISRNAGVIGASTVHHHPADIYQSMDFSAGDRKYSFGFRMVDADAPETLQIQLLKRFGAPEGRLKGWVINESFYRALLVDFTPEEIAAGTFSSAGEEEDGSRTRFEICGVMEDFHYASLHQQIGNFAFAIRDPENNFNRWLMVRYAEGHSEEAGQAIRELMDAQFPGKVYEQFILEDRLDSQYEASRHLSEVIRAFTLLSVLIAVSGLYGLSLFMTRRRSREIGIRKVHGAAASEIILMLNLGFLKWVGIAFILACPLSVWALNRWLMNFAYKTALPWWIFAGSGIFIAVIAMLAVSWQTRLAARTHPVVTLRDD